MGALEALRWAFDRHSGPVALVAASAQLPSHWLTRLTAGLVLDPDCDVVSALDPSVAALNPWPSPTPAASQAPAADALVYRVSTRTFLRQRAISATLSLWRQRPPALGAVTDLHQLGEHVRTLVCNHLLVATGPIARPTSGALDALRATLVDHLQAPPRPGLPGLDGRGAMLHAVHGWGGGTLQWVEDLADGLDDRHHFILVARGDELGRDCGRELALYHATTAGAPLRRWPLPASIRATVTESADYRAVLQAVIDEWQIGQVVVSSLIGHSVDVLRTGLPTLVVLHDYYPAWPRLDVAFELDEGPFDVARVAREHDAAGRLGGLDAETWTEVRQQVLAALQDPSIQVAAPSRSVIRNLARLEAGFGELDITIIPHGHRPLPTGWHYRPPTSPPGRWRLVIPGRINDAKGKTLLLQALDALTPHADIYLVGSGKDGEAFFGRSGVHVIVDYDRDRLPALMAAIDPHAGVLLSTVSETFSYTLSEMWSLGLPVIATRLGALAERIRHDVDGWLIEPRPEALVHAVKTLQVEQLQRWALGVADSSSATVQSMAERYRELLPAPPPQSYRPHLATAAELAAVPAATALLAARERLAVLTARTAEQQRELENRAGWAFELGRQLAERTRWAQRLESDLGAARQAVERLQADFDDRTRWALELNRQVTEQQQLIALRQQHVEALEQALDQAGVALEEAQRAYEGLDERFNQVITSRSWQLTRPLRFAARQSRAVLDRLRFRAGRARTQAQRTRNSLRVRGFRGTVERIRQEFQAPQLPTTPVAAEPDDRERVPLRFPAIDSPRVSVVIPVHNHYRHTWNCLRSLLETANEASFEVVVVDDASSDETVDELDTIDGIVKLRNDENLGFVGTCNRGASAAQGDYVVFLNNDTAVADGWLDALLETFDRFPDAGLVGARLVYPDGRLQEAGGIVFSDGSGWNYGRFEDPDHPAYNFVREVDYCSGAAIMLRRSLFETLGGFDQRYAPAYYEDTDLAFAVRAHGLKVYYQPRSVVTHFEGITSGTDTSSGIKRYQVVNQEKFLAKWQPALAEQPRPGTPILRAREHAHPRRALIIDACTPEPDKDSGSVRMTHLMEILRELGYQVSFLADNRAYVAGYTEALQQRGVEVWFHPWADASAGVLEEIGATIDVVLISRHYIARNYVSQVRRHCPNARLLFDTVDLHYLREERLAALEQDPELAATAARTKQEELGVARSCDATLVVSPHEQAVLNEVAPEIEVAVVSNIHHVHGRHKPFAERRDIMFVGGYQHPPNIDAVQWFVSEVLGLVRQQLPDVVFHIIGSKAPPEVRRLGQVEGVEFHGFVPAIEPWLDNCRLSVAPLRYGAGVKGKVNSSMSRGQPVVATSPAVEGMFVLPGEDVLVADAPQAFADAVIAAYTDEALWTRLSDGGLANVEKYFSFAAARRALQAVLEPATPT